MAKQSLNLGLDSLGTFLIGSVCLQHPHVHLNESFRIVGLCTKLSLRGTLEGSDHLSAAERVAELQLAVRIERERIDSESTELGGVLAPCRLGESHRNLKLVVVVISSAL